MGEIWSDLTNFIYYVIKPSFKEGWMLKNKSVFNFSSMLMQNLCPKRSFKRVEQNV